MKGLIGKKLAVNDQIFDEQGVAFTVTGHVTLPRLLPICGATGLWRSEPQARNKRSIGTLKANREFPCSLLARSTPRSHRLKKAWPKLTVVDAFAVGERVDVIVTKGFCRCCKTLPLSRYERYTVHLTSHPSVADGSTPGRIIKRHRNWLKWAWIVSLLRKYQGRHVDAEHLLAVGGSVPVARVVSS